MLPRISFPLPKYRRGSRARLTSVAAARAFVHTRLRFFNQHYRLAVGRIAIRSQKTRWGSCSATGNLSFNYRLIFLPPVLADYIIVHELCHIQEFNHSPRFWQLVEQTIPNPKQCRKELHRYEL